jgi:hypothetical protein
MVDNHLLSLSSGGNLDEHCLLIIIKKYTMKKLFLLASIAISVIASASIAPSEISEKVLKAFKETFTTATDVTWHEYENVYQANFKQAEVQIRAQYDGDGKLLRTIRYYGESQLMPNIVARLKKKYGDKEIFGVTETTSDQEVSFVINLKDENNWYIVKSDVYGNLEQTDKFKRADK